MPEPYRVNLASPAIRALSRLAPKFADAVLRFLDGLLAENPLRVTKPLTGRFEGLCSGRMGASYRILVRVNPDLHIVHVVAVAHRSDAYRPM